MKALIDGEDPPKTRLCKVCDKFKPLSEFQDHPECFYGKTYTCKDCVRERSRKWDRDNRERKLFQANKRNRATKEKAIEYLGGSCQDCGGKFHRCIYDFHHVDGTKEMNPSKALTKSWDNAVEELNKCVLLCANCHRLRHFKEEEKDESVN